jgi:arylsulfatase A-like enzyme
LLFSEPGTRSDTQRHRIQLYDAEIAYVDTEIGRLLDAFDESSLTDRTLVVITSDHGEGLGDHGYQMHGIHLYEEDVRIPLLLRFPGVVRAGTTIAGPVAGVDIAPTVLDLLGLTPRPDAMPGRSIAPALRGEGELEDRSIFLVRRPYGREQVITDEGTVAVGGVKLAIRDAGWKYIAEEELGSYELYDLESDPTERRDLTSAEPEVARRLAQRIEEWRGRYERPHDVPRLSREDREALEALGYVE